MSGAYRVSIVVDREYGERLSELTERGPVWIVDTPKNRAAAERIWAIHANRTHFDGVTTFKAGRHASREDILIDGLDTIDLHHGTYSADPPYTILEVIGATISERLRNEFSKFGFDDFEETAEGFRAVRSLPSDDPTK
jgi:hypothetical protein